MAAQQFEIRRLSPAACAEVVGIDLSKPLDDEDIGRLRDAWLEHLLLLFRRQRMTPEEHIEFSRRFGELEIHPLFHYRHPDYPEIFHLTNKKINGKPSETRVQGRTWHTDMSYTTLPAGLALLHSLEVPEIGGDTMFANQYLAYESLSDGMKKMLEPLEAVHELFSSYTPERMAQKDAKQVAELKAANPPVAQPVVRVHPETGRKALYLGNVVQRFAGMTRDESKPLLDFLMDHATRPEFIYRHRWNQHDLLVWDNRCLLHMVVGDYDDSMPRLMYRTTVKGQPSGALYA